MEEEADNEEENEINEGIIQLFLSPFLCITFF